MAGVDEPPPGRVGAPITAKTPAMFVVQLSERLKPAGIDKMVSHHGAVMSPVSRVPAILEGKRAFDYFVSRRQNWITGLFEYRLSEDLSNAHYAKWLCFVCRREGVRQE